MLVYIAVSRSISWNPKQPMRPAMRNVRAGRIELSQVTGRSSHAGNLKNSQQVVTQVKGRSLDATKGAVRAEPLRRSTQTPALSKLLSESLATAQLRTRVNASPVH